MFAAAIKDQYDEYEFFYEETKEALDTQVEDWVKDNLDVDDVKEIVYLDESGRFRVAYKVVYEDLSMPKQASKKASTRLEV